MGQAPRLLASSSSEFTLMMPQPPISLVYDAVKLDTLKRRYVSPEDAEQVTMVTKVTKVTGLNADDLTYPSEPCPKCGCEWAVSPQGAYICEKCGHPARGEA